LGIGYPGGKATVTQYPNFIEQLVTHRFTNTKLYSLWLDSKDSEYGSIFFGGIDRDKYYGTLKSMPIHPDNSGGCSLFSVGLESVLYSGIAGSSVPTAFTNSSFTTPVILESSTTLIYLPVHLTNTIYDSFEVFEDTTNDTAVVDCVYKNPSVMSFTFESGLVVNVSST
jgi:hypothetical protein